MTVINNTDTNNIVIFACGGAGIGISKYFESERGNVSPGYAKVSPVYLDTSDASSSGVPSESFFKLPETEGSGGVRRENGADIIMYTKEILQKFPAGDLNIVVASTTGGSGSVFGPSIASELLARGKQVIVFHVGSDDTLQQINNTIDVLTGYEKIAEIREMPVVLQYLHNGKDGLVKEVDMKIQTAISCLTVLYSRQNKNLDNKDLANWLNFSKPGVTSYQPQVSVLQIANGKLETGDRALISLATLNTDLDNTRVDQPVEYQRVGVPLNLDLDGADKSLKFPLHFATTDGFVDVVLKDLRRMRKDFNTLAESRVIRNKLAVGKENVQSNGVIF